MKTKLIYILFSFLMTTFFGNLATAIALEQDNCHHCTELAFSQNSNFLKTNYFVNDILNMELHNSRQNVETEPISTNTQNNTLAQRINVGSILADKKPLGWSTLDFSTPSSPGAKIIGYTGEIGSVSTPNELAIKLLNGLDSDGNGNFQTGIAIDIAPYLLIRGKDFTLADYRKPNAGFERFLANTKISVATSKSDTTARLGVGAEFILIDEGDLRFDPELFARFSTILNKQPAPSSPPEPPTNPTPESLSQYEEALDRHQEAERKKFEEYDNLIKSDIQAAKKAARARATQKSLWVLGAGTSLISPTGRYFDFRSDGTGLWTTYKLGMGGNSELIVHSSYRSGERISDRKNNFFNGDTVTAGARIRTGSEDFKFSLETAYNLESQSSKASNSYLSFGLGLEPRVSDNLWLSLSMKGSTGRENGNDFQMISGIKWNFNNGGN
jgi:hypothetical protein